MRHYLSVLVIGAALMGSAALSAQDRQDRGNHQSQRYYDKTGHDWHDWNDNENQAYRRYLQEHGKKEHDFNRAATREKNDYFKWRHQHPDSADRH